MVLPLPALDPGRGELQVCSTPFGINGSSTSHPAPLPPSLHCAHRLSASMVLPLPMKSDYVFSEFVLNAFRHQRFFHARIALSPAFTTCAQRLSASMVLPRPNNTSING